MVIVCDSYSETNTNSPSSVYTGFIRGQSFTGNGGVLDNVVFYCYKYGTVSGNIYVTIYNHTGAFGTSSAGTGSPIATSDTIDITTLDTSYSLKSFTFSGVNRITLTNGQYYVVAINYDSGNASNCLRVGVDNTSPTHSGNLTSNVSGTWVPSSTADLCFYIYTEATTYTSPFPAFRSS